MCLANLVKLISNVKLTCCSCSITTGDIAGNRTFQHDWLRQQKNEETKYIAPHWFNEVIFRFPPFLIPLNPPDSLQFPMEILHIIRHVWVSLTLLIQKWISQFPFLVDVYSYTKINKIRQQLLDTTIGYNAGKRILKFD